MDVSYASLFEILYSTSYFVVWSQWLKCIIYDKNDYDEMNNHIHIVCVQLCALTMWMMRRIQHVWLECADDYRSSSSLFGRLHSAYLSYAYHRLMTADQS